MPQYHELKEEFTVDLQGLMMTRIYNLTTEELQIEQPYDEAKDNGDHVQIYLRVCLSGCEKLSRKNTRDYNVLDNGICCPIFSDRVKN